MQHLQPACLLGYGSRQSIVGQVEIIEIYQIVDLLWDCAAQLVEMKLKLYEMFDQTELRGDRPCEVIINKADDFEVRE